MFAQKALARYVRQAYLLLLLWTTDDLFARWWLVHYRTNKPSVLRSMLHCTYRLQYDAWLTCRLNTTDSCSLDYMPTLIDCDS